MWARNQLFGLAGPFGLILGFAQLSRAPRDELLEPLAVSADLGHVLDVSDQLDGLPTGIGDARHGDQRPHGFALLCEAFLEGAAPDLAPEQSPELRLDRSFVVAEDVEEATCADLLDRRAEHPAQRAVDPEKPTIRREESLGDGNVLERRLELHPGGGHSCAARRVLPREEEDHAEHVDRVWDGARVRRPDLREVDEDPHRGSRQDRRRARGEEDSAGPIALPDRAGNEESIHLDRQHQEIQDVEGRSGRRADRQHARTAPGERHLAQLEDGSAHRHPLVEDGEEAQYARDERAEVPVAATPELRVEMEEQDVDDHAERDEPVERGLQVTSGIVLARKNAVIAGQKTVYAAHWTQKMRRTRS